MVTRSKRPRDINQLAKLIVDLSTGDAEEKPESAKAMAGRLGGLKGGASRMGSLTDKQRKELAEKAARSRWSKAK